MYDGMAVALKDQLRTTITDRRIFSLRYTHDKKKRQLQVGQLEQQEKRYEVMAIFESSPYIVFTQAKGGDHGITILVNKDEVTDIEDFA